MLLEGALHRRVSFRSTSRPRVFRKLDLQDKPGETPSMKDVVAALRKEKLVRRLGTHELAAIVLFARPLMETGDVEELEQRHKKLHGMILKIRSAIAANVK